MATYLDGAVYMFTFYKDLYNNFKITIALKYIYSIFYTFYLILQFKNKTESSPDQPGLSASVLHS